MTNDPLQKIMLTIGNFGCYFLSICKAAEIASRKNIEPIGAYIESVARGWIGKDCFLNNPDKIIELLIGDRWTVEKQPIEYAPQDGEIVILYYEQKIAMGVSGHFVLGNINKKVIYDPMGASQTVLHGTLKSLRIIRKVNP